MIDNFYYKKISLIYKTWCKINHLIWKFSKLRSCSIETALSTLSRMGLFGADHDGEAKRPIKICHIYPTIMKPGTVIPDLKKIKIDLKHVTHPIKFCWHQHFFAGNFTILINIDYRWYFGS